GATHFYESSSQRYLLLFFFHATATTEIHTLSLHDALPIFASGTSPWVTRLSWRPGIRPRRRRCPLWHGCWAIRFVRSSRSMNERSEEHTSELQSRGHLVCRLPLEKKNHLDFIARHPQAVVL